MRFLPLTIWMAVFSLWMSNLEVYPQQVAVKTNALYWTTTTPNLSVETALGNKVTLELQGSYNPFQFGTAVGNKKIKHWLLMPAVRLWVYEKFDGHFFGLHTFYGRYNLSGMKLPAGIFSGLRDNRYEGYGAGVGLSYGYQWYLGPHWNLEAEFGFGYAYLDYDVFECRRCGSRRGSGTHHYFGPTKLGLSFVYLFKSKNR